MQFFTNQGGGHPTLPLNVRQCGSFRRFAHQFLAPYSCPALPLSALQAFYAYYRQVPSGVGPPESNRSPPPTANANAFNVSVAELGRTGLIV